MDKENIKRKKPTLEIDLHLAAFKEINAILDRVCANTSDKFKILGSVEMKLKLDQQLKEIAGV